jgi:hypothetical protein
VSVECYGEDREFGSGEINKGMKVFKCEIFGNRVLFSIWFYNRCSGVGSYISKDSFVLE